MGIVAKNDGNSCRAGFEGKRIVKVESVASLDRFQAQAIWEMSDKGYGGTSIGDIAQAVGMTKAGLYHHISGKQDLLYQILNHAMDELNPEGRPSNIIQTVGSAPTSLEKGAQ